MLHIGMIGPEYAAARTKLMAPLSGNSGWLAGPPEKAPEEPPVAEEAIPAEEQAPEADPVAEASAAAQGEEAEEAEAHD